MKKLYLVSLCLLLAACSPSPATKDDPAYYVAQFEKTYNIHVEVPIHIVDKDEMGNAAGICTYYIPIKKNDPSSYIKLERSYWNVSTEYGRQELVFHELGHCVFGLQHDARLGYVGGHENLPVSIMYPITFGNSPFYSENLKYYHDELDQSR